MCNFLILNLALSYQPHIDPFYICFYNGNDDKIVQLFRVMGFTL